MLHAAAPIDGQQLFGPPVFYPTDTGPVWVHAADLNADGSQDLAVACEDGRALRLLFNDGKGGLHRSASYGGFGTPSSVTSADFDGDGLADLAVADWVRGRVTVLANRGAGLFEPVTQVAGHRPLKLVAGDLTGDGRPDLAYVGGSPKYGLGFGARDRSTRLGLLVNEGGLSFQEHAVPQPQDGMDDVWAGDLDADGDADLVVIGLGWAVSLTSDGEGGFLEPHTLAALEGTPGYSSTLVLSDLNRDGLRDLVTASWPHNGIALWRAAGIGAYDRDDRQFFPDLGQAVGVCAGDLNGDGWPDVASFHLYREDSARYGEVFILLNDTAGTHAVAASHRVGYTIPGPAGSFLFRGRLICVDINDDGDLDLVGTRRASASVFVLHNLTRGANAEPVAHAQTPVRTWVEDEVVLDGSQSQDPEGEALTFEWRQVAGRPVALRDAERPQGRFITPRSPDTLAFELVVRDASGIRGRPDTAVVRVHALHYDPPPVPTVSPWTRVHLAAARIEAIVAASAHNALLAATGSGGLLRSIDGGSVWEPAEAGLDHLPVTQLVAGPEGTALYARAGDRGWVYRSADGGVFWQALESEGWHLGGMHSIGFIGDDLYLGGGEFSGLGRWDEEGSYASDANYNLPGTDISYYSSTVHSMAADPFDPRIRYAIVSPWSAEVYRTLNGIDWEKIDAARDHRIGDRLYVSPHTGWLYALVRISKLYRSKRLGDAWEPIRDGIEPTHTSLGSRSAIITSLAFDPVSIPMAYAGTENGVYASPSGGDVWLPMAGSPPGVTALATAPGRLYVGTETGEIHVADLRSAGETSVTHVEHDATPTALSLAPSFPNPFNAGTNIVYHVPGRASVTVTVYDAVGQPVRQLVAATQPAGKHRLWWDGTNDLGQPVASGVYVVRLAAGTRVRSSRLLLVR